MKRVLLFSVLFFVRCSNNEINPSLTLKEKEELKYLIADKMSLIKNLQNKTVLPLFGRDTLNKFKVINFLNNQKVNLDNHDIKNEKNKFDSSIFEPYFYKMSHNLDLVPLSLPEKFTNKLEKKSSEILNYLALKNSQSIKGIFFLIEYNFEQKFNNAEYINYLINKTENTLDDIMVNGSISNIYDSIFFIFYYKNYQNALYPNEKFQKLYLNEIEKNKNNNLKSRMLYGFTLYLKRYIKKLNQEPNFIVFDENNFTKCYNLLLKKIESSKPIHKRFIRLKPETNFYFKYIIKNIAVKGYKTINDLNALKLNQKTLNERADQRFKIYIVKRNLISKYYESYKNEYEKIIKNLSHTFTKLQYPIVFLNLSVIDKLAKLMYTILNPINESVMNEEKELLFLQGYLERNETLHNLYSDLFKTNHSYLTQINLELNELNEKLKKLNLEKTIEYIFYNVEEDIKKKQIINKDIIFEVEYYGLPCETFILDHRGFDIKSLFICKETGILQLSFSIANLNDYDLNLKIYVKNKYLPNFRKITEEIKNQILLKESYKKQIEHKLKILNDNIKFTNLEISHLKSYIKNVSIFIENTKNFSSMYEYNINVLLCNLDKLKKLKEENIFEKVFVQMYNLLLKTKKHFQELCEKRKHNYHSSDNLNYELYDDISSGSDKDFSKEIDNLTTIISNKFKCYNLVEYVYNVYSEFKDDYLVVQFINLYTKYKNDIETTKINKITKKYIINNNIKKNKEKKLNQLMHDLKCDQEIKKSEEYLIPIFKNFLYKKKYCSLRPCLFDTQIRIDNPIIKLLKSNFKNHDIKSQNETTLNDNNDKITNQLNSNTNQVPSVKNTINSFKENEVSKISNNKLKEKEKRINEDSTINQNNKKQTEVSIEKEEVIQKNSNQNYFDNTNTSINIKEDYIPFLEAEHFTSPLEMSPEIISPWQSNHSPSHGRLLDDYIDIERSELKKTSKSKFKILRSKINQYKNSFQ